jgi:hypothetical protein
MKFEQVLGLLFFGLTLIAYAVLFYLGRRWRREFEAKGVTYWQAPKEERLRELTDDVFRPRLFAAFYGLAYFANGYMKITFSMWAPLYLLQVRGVSTFDAALFLGLVYMSWQWKMFIGLLSDGFPVTFRGNTYRRHPYFIAAGILSLIALLGFLTTDPTSIPVWSHFFPLCLAMTTAGALFDIAADSFAVDVTPPEYHARVLGGVNTFGMAIGGVAASLISPYLISVGSYWLVFMSGGLVGMLAFPFLKLKEPKLEKERLFSREAIAFTFTERTVLVASLLMVGTAIGTQRLSNPTGGMFSLIMPHHGGEHRRRHPPRRGPRIHRRRLGGRQVGAQAGLHPHRGRHDALRLPLDDPEARDDGLVRGPRRSLQLHRTGQLGRQDGPHGGFDAPRTLRHSLPDVHVLQLGGEHPRLRDHRVPAPQKHPPPLRRPLQPHPGAPVPGPLLGTLRGRQGSDRVA